LDNVLLELILAMELHAVYEEGASCMHPCMELFPILMDTFPNLDELPDKVSELTYAEASKILVSCGLGMLELNKKTVRGVVKQFFDLQVEKLTDLGKSDLALSLVCTKIISAVREAVSKCNTEENFDMLSLFGSKPLCSELHDFLSKRNCSHMTRILAANNITSVRKLSLFAHQQQAIYDLAQQCSSVSSKSTVAELTTLISVIEESRHDEASWLLSARLDRFVDRDASFETVIKSSCGLIISCAQKTWLTLYFILGLILLFFGGMSIDSSGAGGNTIFYIVGAVFLFIVCVTAVIHSPKRAYVVLCCMFPALEVSVIIGFSFDFIKNGSFSLDNATRCATVGSQLQTSFRTCAVLQILCGPFLLFFFVLLNFYHALHRQDLVWSSWLCSSALYLVTEVVFQVSVLGYSASSPVTNYVILVGVACIFTFTEWMCVRARGNLFAMISYDKQLYDYAWNELCRSEEEVHQLHELDAILNSLQSMLKFTGSGDVHQDCRDIDVLYARAEFINDAFQSLVPILFETWRSSVHECGSSKTEPMELEAFFAKEFLDDIKAMLQPKHHDDKKTAGQHTKDGECSAKAAVLPSEQMSQSTHIPGQTYNTNDDVAVNIENNALVHEVQDRNETKKSGTVLARRGPVKLPSRAIAKVSQPHE
jgi:hypothetical protein